MYIIFLQARLVTPPYPSAHVVLPASKMLVDKNRIAEVYHLIKNSVRDEGSSVLICVAGECDAIAACHILVVPTSDVRWAHIT